MDALLIHSDSSCPSESAVIEGVRDLTNPEQRAAAPRNASVVISDRGDGITVTITRDGQATIRDYRDAARDCERRAHFAAVLTVVSLLPPASSEPEPVSVAEPAPAPAADPVTVPRPASPEAPPRPAHVRIELGAVTSFSTPISDSLRAFSPATLLGVALGPGKLRLTLTTRYAPPVAVDYTGPHAGRAELQRLEAGAGARLSLWRHAVDLSAELGLLASRAQLRGLSTRQPEQDTSFSLGGRAGFHVGVTAPWLVSPFLAIHAEAFPFAAAVAQLPAGSVGHLPYCWLGVSAGLALAL